MLLFDGHLDLAMNALSWNRDLSLPLPETRQHEVDASLTKAGCGRGTVAFPEMRQGEVFVSLATLIARVQGPGNPFPGYRVPEAAYAAAQGQLAYYRLLEEQGVVRIIEDWPALEAHRQEWETAPASAPLGLIITMEGADPIVAPEQVHRWKEHGLRAIGLSHYGFGRYAHGTSTEGGLTDLGRALLPEAEAAGLILDLTHLADQAFWEAIEQFNGPVQASHQCCRALVPGERQMDDEQLRALLERNAVIGAALDAWMLHPGWVKGKTENNVCGLCAVADQIDHVCQLAGDSLHAAVGSDLDGGFGQEQTPYDCESIADLQKLNGMLRERGYSEQDVTNVFHGNLLRLFERAWAN